MPGSMEPADSISRLGFARWYERQLIEGHAWFVSGFACMIAVAAQSSFRPAMQGVNCAATVTGVAASAR